MTELQVTINNLKDMLTSGNRLLFRLEKAQKDLEIRPVHKWEHGDIFRNDCDVEMIYIKLATAPPQAFCLGSCTGHDKQDVELYLTNAKFLFNIKEKL